MRVEIYDGHQKAYLVVRVMTSIVFSDEFKLLSKELERVYKIRGMEKAEVQAFHDALYCCISQKEDFVLAQSL